jgi:hypothetical protein
MLHVSESSARFVSSAGNAFHDTSASGRTLNRIRAPESGTAYNFGTVSGAAILNIDLDDPDNMRAMLTCNICMVNQRDTVLGCHHTSTCCACIRKLDGVPKRCPVCNAVITSHAPIFL